MLDLLEGKVSPEARRVAAYASGAVRRPRSPPPSAGWPCGCATWPRARTTSPSLSLMASRQRVGGYAAAVHEDMSNEELESIEDDLFRFARIVASTPALRSR